ncbi:peptidase A2 [Alteromonas aestuariivivens]|uniref:Peptidase A2 n=1 Tax=Alteromonas aestuariivivens TaxID=1938339 RepID=A0A3D8M4F6_9ALTE|nr:retropepsin-like aspartic protease [Alteromonas aestuariivivens]RDV24623.1 peptidase A2 [Alteromonas aestuariivivens]
MRLAITLLSILLLASLAVNGWLLWRIFNHAKGTQLHLISPSNQTKPTDSVYLPPNLKSGMETVSPDVPLSLDDAIERLTHSLQQGDYDEVAFRLTELLQANPENAELLLLEAELIALTQPLSEALMHYYSLLEMPLPPAERQKIYSIINELSENAIRQLKEDQAWDLMAQLLEPLFQLLPEHRGYILGLAEAYGQQQKMTLMEDVLASLPPNDSQAQIIRQRAFRARETGFNRENISTDKPVDREPGGEQRLSLIRVGDQFLAQIRIGERPTNMLLDTGASTTAISSQVFEQIKSTQRVRFIGVFDVNTAAGKIRAPLVQLPQVTLGPYQFSDLSVLVMPVGEMQRAEGLLGMNVLKVFDFRIDQVSDQLVLREH